MTKLGRIDVHTHIVPDFYRDWCIGNRLDTENLKMPLWSREMALAFMDQADIQSAILSISAPGVDLADANEAAGMARRLNEYTAQLVADMPNRFGYFAVLPQQDVDAALAEIAFAFDDLQADGVILRPHVGGTYLGDPFFAPVLEELNRRRAVILLHPSELPGGSARDIPAFLADFLLDTVRGAVSLMRSGAMDRYQALRIILSHAGGFLPFVAARIAARVSPREDELDGHRLMRRFYLDTSLSSSPTSLPSISAFADSDKLMVGTDFPFAPRERCNAFLKELDAFQGIDHASINKTNAQELFPGRF